MFPSAFVSASDEIEVVLFMILAGFEGPYVSGNFLVTQGVGKGSGQLQIAKQKLGKWYFPCSETQKYQMEIIPCFRDEDAIFPFWVGNGVCYGDDELESGI